MTSRNIHLGSLSWSGAGEFCGAGMSADAGQGFHTPFGSQLSLPQTTGGAVWDDRLLAAGTLDLATEINTLIDAVHACD